MKKKVNRKKKNSQLYAVIGLGRFGSALAEDLAKKGKEVIAIDRDRAKVDAASEFTPNGCIMDERTAENLAEAGVAEADAAIIGIGEKLDVSILTTMTVIKMGVKKVIAKAKNAEQGEILSILGAEVVYPEHDMALRLSGKLVSPHILEYISLSDGVDIMELQVTDKIAGKTVIELDVRRSYHLNIIAVRHDGNITTDIYPDMHLAAGDTVTVIGKTADIIKFEDYMNS